MWRWRPFLGIIILLASTPLFALAAPVALTLAAVVDLGQRRSRLPSVRLLSFAAVYLVHQYAGIGHLVRLTVDGRRRDTNAHRRIQAWWIGSLLRWADRLLGVSFAWPELTLPPGHLIVLSRHSSPVDAAFPAYWLTHLEGRPAHYVMKNDLRFDPCIALFGHRLGTAFIDRTSGREATAAIRRLAADALPDAGVVVFPEGTYANHHTRQRVLRSLIARAEHGAADHPDSHAAVELARALRHLLPPRPAGTLAVLEELPEAPIVLLAPRGLEDFSGWSQLRRRVPLRRSGGGPTVEIAAWLIDRADVPGDAGERRRWLEAEWRGLDIWLNERHEQENGTT